MFIRSMFSEGRRTSRLQERRLADIALDVLGLLVDLELRLGDFGVFVLAIALGCGFGSVSHFDGCEESRIAE